MRLRLVSGAVLLTALVALQPGRSAEPDRGRPTVVVRVQSLDALIADVRYLAEMFGKAEEAKQGEGFLKSMIGPNGLQGIDTTKPFGIYAQLKPAVPDSPFAVMLPVADEKALTGMLEGVGVKSEKQENGTFKVALPGLPLPAFYRFANKYAYVTVGKPENLDPAGLLTPEAVFAGKDAGLLAATVNINQVPEKLREFVLGEAARRAAIHKKEKLPNETDVQHKFRGAAIEEAMTQFKSLLKDGQSVNLRFDVDRQASDLGWTLNVTAKSGSPLADLIEGLGKHNSIGASLLGHDAAVNGLLHVALPGHLRKALEPVIDEALDKAVKQAQDEAHKGLLETLLKGITPTLKAAEIDAGMNMRGPSANGLYTLLVGFKVKDGMGIENALKEVMKVLPPDAKDRVTMDVDKVGKVGIHKVVPEHVDAQTKALLGDNPVYFAVRDDAVLLGAGEKGLSALKEAVEAGPAPGQPLHFEASLARLAPLMVRDNKGAPAAAKKAFTEKNGDKVLMTLEGGKTLKVRLSAKGQVLHFFALLDEMKKKEL